MMMMMMMIWKTVDQIKHLTDTDCTENQTQNGISIIQYATICTIGVLHCWKSGKLKLDYTCLVSLKRPYIGMSRYPVAWLVNKHLTIWDTIHFFHSVTIIITLVLVCLHNILQHITNQNINRCVEILTHQVSWSWNSSRDKHKHL